MVAAAGSLPRLQLVIVIILPLGDVRLLVGRLYVLRTVLVAKRVDLAIRRVVARLLLRQPVVAQLDKHFLLVLRISPLDHLLVLVEHPQVLVFDLIQFSIQLHILEAILLFLSVILFFVGVQLRHFVL